MSAGDGDAARRHGLRAGALGNLDTFASGDTAVMVLVAAAKPPIPSASPMRPASAPRSKTCAAPCPPQSAATISCSTGPAMKMPARPPGPSPRKPTKGCRPETSRRPVPGPFAEGRRGDSDRWRGASHRRRSHPVFLARPGHRGHDDAGRMVTQIPILRPPRTIDPRRRPVTICGWAHRLNRAASTVCRRGRRGRTPSDAATSSGSACPSGTAISCNGQRAPSGPAGVSRGSARIINDRVDGAEGHRGDDTQAEPDGCLRDPPRPHVQPRPSRTSTGTSRP